MSLERWKQRPIGGVSVDRNPDFRLKRGIDRMKLKKADDEKENKGNVNQIQQSVSPYPELPRFRKGRIGANWKTVKQVRSHTGAIVVSIAGKDTIKEEHIIDVFRNDGLYVPYGERPRTEYLESFYDYRHHKKEEGHNSKQEPGSSSNSQNRYTAYFTHAFGGTWNPMKPSTRHSKTKPKLELQDPEKNYSF